MNTITSTVKLRDFRNDMQKYFDAVREGHSFTIMKRSKPVAQISQPVVDEWGDEVLPGDIHIDFRKAGYPNGIPAEELLKKMRDF
jgi:hypothetical protein